MKALNPDARLIETDRSRVGPEAIVDTGRFGSDRAPERPPEVSHPACVQPRVVKGSGRWRCQPSRASMGVRPFRTDCRSRPLQRRRSAGGLIAVLAAPKAVAVQQRLDPAVEALDQPARPCLSDRWRSRGSIGRHAGDLHRRGARDVAPAARSGPSVRRSRRPRPSAAARRAGPSLARIAARIRVRPCA
jgi:hypothetical protein